MTYLVVGGGGREHTIIRKLKESPDVEKIYCTPGNGGISKDAEVFDVAATDIDGVVALAQKLKVDCVFVAPDDPLVAGISADMKARGENTFKNYFVPEAYMELRQGLGRLIRTESDSGKIVILDNRVVNEAYGKTFMRIWNNKQQVASSIDELKSFVS